ncbi:dynamin family protein [Bacillus sp. FJAT-45350]|uniref:dynamin family protein n=1 Tax=Bacillus sp. FJAT-45350 TaxID=2011014 RepID=UPI000BB824FC|nr:dynamin family protein [Bacillus sp. FJAT-45350]
MLLEQKKKHVKDHILELLNNQSLTLSDLEQRLLTIKKQIDVTGDIERIEKFHVLLEKLKNNEFIIAFCGHFSAGKSTLINQLLGEEILPSHPIPTSANVVKMKHGTPEVVIKLKDEQSIRLDFPLDISQLQEYCKDGEQVDTIEISHNSSILPRGITFIDTPGIDSTDDAHQLATESSLLMADYVVYMMDYHHVESEVNIHFIKQLNKQMKQCLLIVNQIDKHIDAELSFETYVKKIRSALYEQKLVYDVVYFTSAIDETYKYNQLSKLQEKLSELIHHTDNYLISSVLKEAYMLALDHLDWVKKQKDKEIAEFSSILAPNTLKDKDDIENLLKVVKEKLTHADDIVEAFEEEFSHSLERILEQGNIMPYHTRNAARDYLEANQIGYKIGTFFSRKKTKAEQNKRFNKFYMELRDNAITYFDIHIKDLLLKHCTKYELHDESLLCSIQLFEGDVSESVITGSLNKGALFTHDYVLNYCQRVMEATRAHYRQKTFQLFDEAIDLMSKQAGTHKKSLIRQRDDLERKKHALTELLKIEDESIKLLEEFETVLLSNWGFSKEGKKESEQQNIFNQGTKPTEKKKRFAVNLDEFSKDEEVSEVDVRGIQRANQQLADHLKRLSEDLKAYPGLKIASKELNDRGERLEKNQFTLALFGAFSAGKSSFANALAGEKLLPVSPNPTTATINYLIPPTEEYPHGTVYLTYKTKEQLVSDVNNVLYTTDFKITSLDELFVLMKKWEEVKNNKENEQEDDKNKKKEKDEANELLEYFYLFNENELAYLYAVRDGYHGVEENVGKRRRSSLEEFYQITDDEKLASFIESVEIYYSCELTRNGIILVDTPGADSIHRRHTELAFDFVKKADAILFVSYYNHSFSRADKEFLIQLGRVKDFFEKDKMFFLLNAADLAKDKEELQRVIDHLESELLRCNIRQPQIYPVSSMLSLTAKLVQKGMDTKEERELLERFVPIEYVDTGLKYTGLHAFQEHLYKMSLENFSKLSSVGATQELHSIKSTILDWIQSSKKDQLEKEVRLKQVSLLKDKANDIVTEFGLKIEEKLLVQEIDELLYYVKQRIFYRYFDEFKTIFQPTRFQEREFSQALTLCMKETSQFLSYDMIQEFRATVFRVELFITKLIKVKYSRISKEIMKAEQSLLLNQIHDVSLETYNIPEVNLSVIGEVKKKLLDKYNDKILFFTEKQNLQLRDELEEYFRPLVSQYVTENRDRIQQFYLQLLIEENSHIEEIILDRVKEFIEGETSILTKEVDVDKWNSSLQRINKVMKLLANN